MSFPAIRLGASSLSEILGNTIKPPVIIFIQPQTVVVCTTKEHVANQCNINWGTVPLLLPSTRLNLGQIRDKVR